MGVIKHQHHRIAKQVGTGGGGSHVISLSKWREGNSLVITTEREESSLCDIYIKGKEGNPLVEAFPSKRQKPKPKPKPNWTLHRTNPPIATQLAAWAALRVTLRDRVGLQGIRGVQLGAHSDSDSQNALTSLMFVQGIVQFLRVFTDMTRVGGGGLPSMTPSMTPRGG